MSYGTDDKLKDEDFEDKKVALAVVLYIPMDIVKAAKDREAESLSGSDGGWKDFLVESLKHSYLQDQLIKSLQEKLKAAEIEIFQLKGLSRD